MGDQRDGTNGEKPSIYSNRSLIHRLERRMEERFREEQEMLDLRVDRRLELRDANLVAIIADAVKTAIAPLLATGTAKPSKDSSAAISAPGIILSQKQVVTGVSVLIAIVALKVLGIDSDTIADFIIGLFVP